MSGQIPTRDSFDDFALASATELVHAGIVEAELRARTAAILSGQYDLLFPDAAKVEREQENYGG